MKNSVLVLPVIAGTLCCLAGAASAQVSTSNRAPVVLKNTHAEGVAFTDNCGNAAGVGDGLYSYDLSAATNDFAASCGASASAPDMWVAYTAAVDGLATATTCGFASSDTVLAVVDGCGGGEIICNDDTCGVQSSVTWSITAGTTYYVRVAGYNGNVHAGQVEISSIGGDAPVNDLCADALEAVSGSSYEYNTSFAGTDGAASCGFLGDPGSNDVWYKITADRDGMLIVGTCGTSFDTILSAYDGCGGAELGCNDDACDLQSQIAVNVTNGQQVWVRVSGYAGDSGAGTISFDLRDPCVLSQPAGAFVEPEDCGGDVNGGCNDDPEFRVTPVNVDTVIWGSAWADADFRDTDWYEITLNEARDLTVSVTAGFGARIIILDAACPATIQYGTAFSTFQCEEASVTMSLDAGTYRVFCGANSFAGTPCGSPGTTNNYILTIGNPPTGCAADFNGDDFLDFFDYDDYVNCFESGNCPPGKTADFNNDDFVDFFDYDDYVAAFETGC